jgi:hypothetical protein
MRRVALVALVGVLAVAALVRKEVPALQRYLKIRRM